MIRLLLLSLLSLFLVNCGGGSSSATIDKTSKELLTNRVLYSTSCSSENKTIYQVNKFDDNYWYQENYEDKEMTELLDKEVYQIIEYQDSEFNMLYKEKEYNCQVSSLEDSRIFVDCIYLDAKENDLSDINVALYSDKEEAILDAISCN